MLCRSLNQIGKRPEETLPENYAPFEDCLSVDSEPDPTVFARQYGVNVPDESGNWWPIIAGRLGGRLQESQKELEETKKKLDRVKREGRMEMDGVKTAQEALIGVREVELQELRTQLEQQE